MMRKSWDDDYGERVTVVGNGYDLRGWLERVDDAGVTVRLPSKEHPESPGDDVVVAAYPPPRGSITVITCTSVWDHCGLMIGFLDPTWERTDEEARASMKITPVAHPDDERRVRIALRLRAISLAVPLAEAHVWNDWARMPMREQAEAEVDADLALNPITTGHDLPVSRSTIVFTGYRRLRDMALAKANASD